MIALASQLGHFLGIFAAIAAIILSIRRHAVTGCVFTFLRLCHFVLLCRAYRDAVAGLTAVNEPASLLGCEGWMQRNGPRKILYVL